MTNPETTNASSFDGRSYRNALGTFPTGVAVILATHAQDHMAIAVNSLTSVSLDPPLLLWCLAKKSERYSHFIGATSYTINVLRSDHQIVCADLSMRGVHHVARSCLRRTQTDTPAFVDAMAVFECEAEATYDAGDHSILIARVTTFSHDPVASPLVFFRGAYAALAQR